MINQAIYKAATVNSVIIKVAVILALLLLSLLMPEVAFASPTPGSTGG